MLRKSMSILIALMMLFSVAVSASGSIGSGASGGGIGGSGNSGTGTSPATPVSPITMSEPEVSLVNGNAYEVSVDIENLTSDAVLRIALYNGNQLTGFINRTIFSATTAGGTAGAAPLTQFQINASKSDKAKVFLFDKEKPLSVLCSSEKDLNGALDLMLTLSGTTISGGTYKNVTVSSAVGNGEVYLNDVEIKGDLNIYGGGNNSIELFGCKVDGKILMAKEPGGTPPRLYLANTPVSKIDVSRDALIEAADAASAIEEIDTVVDVHVQGASTVVNKINVLENSSRTVSVGGTATINEVVAKAPIMVTSNTIKKVEIPKDVTQKINVNVMVNSNVEIAVNSEKGADITADIPGANVTVSTELEEAPEVTIGGEKIEHIHKWNEGSVTKEPTYAEEGCKVFNCSCGESKTESIPKLVGKDFYKFVENYNGSPLRISWEPSTLLTDGKYYLKFNGSTQTTIGTSKTVTGLAPALMEEALPMVLSLQIYSGNNFSDYVPLYPAADIANVTVTAEVPQFTIEKDASGNYNFVSNMKGGMWLYSIYDENGLYYQDNDVNGAISPYAPQKLADGDIVKARYLTWTLNENKTFANFTITSIGEYAYTEEATNPGYYFTYNQYGLFVNWPEYNLADDEEYYVTVTNKTNDMSSGQHPALIVAPMLVGKTQNEKTSITVHKGTDFGSYSPIYNEYEIANLTVSGETPDFTISKDTDGNLSFDFDFSQGMLIYSVSSGYSGGTTNGSTKAPLEDGYTVTAQLMTWTLNADNTYADINITMPKTVTYSEAADDTDEIEITMQQSGNNITATWTGGSAQRYAYCWQDASGNRSSLYYWAEDGTVTSYELSISLPRLETGNATYDFVLYEIVNNTLGNEVGRLKNAATVTVSGSAIGYASAFNSPSNGTHTMTFDTLPTGNRYLGAWYRDNSLYTTNNGAIASSFTSRLSLEEGDTYDLRILNSYALEGQTIKATITPPSKKTYALASDGNIWFSETDYGYPCVQWSPAELSDDEFYVCNDMEWFDTTGYLYFELLNIEESGYIPITISRGTWENKTPLYTSNEAAHVTITDTEQNLSLVEESDGRYKITSHLNNFDTQCFVWQLRSKDGNPLSTGFTTGKITVSPSDDLEVVVRQVKWNISSDKKQIEYTITPLYKITTYTNTQTQTEETYVSTYDELKAALNKGGVVKLNADINTTSRLTLNTGDAATLDLNGHTLDIPNIEARNGKNLTINQTASGSRLINSNGTQEVRVYYGDLTLNGGTYEKIGSQHANNITLNGISGSYNDYSFYYGKNVSITDCTFGSAENASRINVWEADKATITDTVVYGNNSAVAFSSVDKAVVENTTVNASYYAISCQTNTNLELKNVNATAESETIRVHSGCNVTIDGGEYEVTTSYSDLMYMIGGPTVTIKGGKFTGGKNLASPSAANVGALNISGGDFTYYTNALLGKAMTCNVSGGSFGYDVSEYIEDDCTCTNNSDGTYTVSALKTDKNNIWLEMDGDDLNLVFEDEEGLETDQWYYYYQNGTMLTSDSVNYIDITWYLKNITESTLCSFEIKKGVYNSQESVATLENAVDVVLNSNIPNVSVSPQADGSYKLSSSNNTGYFYTVKNPDGTSITSGFTSDGTLLCGLYEGCTIDVRECSITVADDALSADVIMSASVTLSDITLATSSTEEVEVSNLMALQSTIDAGKVAVLTDDISSDSRIYFKTGAPATIKLNGHTITAPTLMAGSGKTLTVDGTVAGSAVANTFNANAYSNVTLLGGSYGNVIIAKARRFYADGITASTSTANRTLQGNWCSDITIKNSSFEHIGALQYQIAISMDDCKNITLENVDVSSAGVYSYGADISRCENTVITGGAYNSAQYPGLRIVDGSATITNAKVGSGGDRSAFLAQDGAQVIISGGTYATPSSSIIGLSNDATRVTINGGSFCSTSTYATKHVSYMNDSSDLLTINGGTFSGVTGLCSYPERAKVCGGTFSFDPSNAIDASKYGVTSNTDGTYTIYKKAEATISNLRIVHYISTIYGIHWDGEAPTGPSGNYYKVYGTSDGGTTWQLIEYAYFETKYPLSSQSATNYNGIKVEYIKDGIVAATITDLTLNVKSEVITSSTVPAATFAEPDANGQSAVTVTGLTPNTYFRLVVDGKVAGMSTKSFVATSSSQGSAQGRLSLSADEINNGSYKVYEFVNPTISDDGKNFSYAVAESAWQNCKNIQ